MTYTTRARHLLQLIIAAIILCCAIAITSTTAVERHSQETLRFQLDPSQSKFMARAFAGGLLFFKGHDHFVAAREFSGKVEFTPNSLTPASLELIVKADSLAETRDVFTPPQKEIINKELREIVLEPAKYPEIVFRSTDVTGKFEGGHYDVKIAGNLTLHGVTRRIVIPAQVTLTGSDLRSVGKFSIDRSDYGVKATSAAHGLVRVRNKIEFTFDIVAHRL
jgi:polyisoprenoid-binding protein YceI